VTPATAAPSPPLPDPAPPSIPAWIRQLPLAAAPMAALSHSAFRRLVAGFGGCDLLHSEMLAGKAILQEDPARSPWLRRVPGDGAVAYQLLLRDADRLPAIVERLAACNPAAIDLNCACPAATVCHTGGGASLFEDAPRLDAVIRELRRAWPGRLTAKLRLGKAPAPGWRDRFTDRLRLLEDRGLDALTIHPRFAADRLARPAQHHLLPWIRSLTPLPLTANGDIAGPEDLARRPDCFAGWQGVMLGRAAIARPWTFAAWKRPDSAAALASAPAAAWQRLAELVREEFPPEKALGKLKLYANWYSRNFLFGRTFHNLIRNSPSFGHAQAAAGQFLAANPAPAPYLCLNDI